MRAFTRRSSAWLPALAICSVVAAIVLIPLLATALGGLRTNGELLTEPFSIPKTLHSENFGRVLAGGSPFWGELINSLLTVGGTLAVLLLAARQRRLSWRASHFQGENWSSTSSFLACFPLTVAVLPLYITIRSLGLLDSLWGDLPQAAFALPTTILILRNFFRAVPRELEDAATIDGASTLGFFWRVLLPLCRPALAVVSMLAAVASWNNFLLPLLVLNDDSTWTLPLGGVAVPAAVLDRLGRGTRVCTVAMIPAIAIHLLAERQIVAGLTAGAVKGLKVVRYPHRSWAGYRRETGSRLLRNRPLLAARTRPLAADPRPGAGAWVRMIETYVPWSVHETAPGVFDWGVGDPRESLRGLLPVM